MAESSQVLRSGYSYVLHHLALLKMLPSPFAAYLSVTLGVFVTAPAISRLLRALHITFLFVFHLESSVHFLALLCACL